MTVRARAVLLGAVLPVTLLAAAFALVLSWRDRLPDPMALHWGVDGVDRVGSFTEHLLPLAVMSLVICVPAVVLALVIKGATRRMMVGISAAMGAMMAGIGVGSTAVQLDAPDVDAIGSPGPAIVIPLIGALVIGFLASWLAGADEPLPASSSVPDDAARLPLAEGTSAVWSRRLPSVPLAFPIAAVVVLLATAVWFGMQTGDWWMLIFPALIAILFVFTSGWRAQVDRTGLTLYGALGRPRHHVPVEEIVRADLTQVHPLREFGGWGMRVGHSGALRGALGFVSRSGEAFVVERTGDRRVVVTVDGAAQAAALLNTLAERARSSSPAE